MTLQYRARTGNSESDGYWVEDPAVHLHRARPVKRESMSSFVVTTGLAREKARGREVHQRAKHLLDEAGTKLSNTPGSPGKSERSPTKLPARWGGRNDQ